MSNAPIIPAGASPAQLQAWLVDAQTKLHLLRTGRLSVEVEVEGRKVKYARTDESGLLTHITDLTNTIENRSTRRGAIGFLL